MVFLVGYTLPSSWRDRRACIMGALWYALIFLAGLAFAAYMVRCPTVRQCAMITAIKAYVAGVCVAEVVFSPVY